MFYREAGQFKTTYVDDGAIFPIRQDRIGVAVILALVGTGALLASVLPAIRWFVDGVQVQEQKEWSSSGGPYPAPFDQKYFLVLNLAIGGGFGGPVGADTRFPVQFKVDHVRVLQR